MSTDSQSYPDAIGSLIDQTKRLAKAEAKVARVEAAIRLLGNEDITPAGARVLRAALNAKDA